ncbi:unnamed protein product [Camellia sinensis]
MDSKYLMPILGGCVMNESIGAFVIVEMLYASSLLAIVGAGEQVLVVILQEKTYIYDISSLDILDTIDTVPNFKGLCAFSPSLDGCFLALPASTTKGSVLVYNIMERHSHCEIDAHRSPLAVMVLSSNGMYIATASEQGTIIRVHLVSDVTKFFRSRRPSSFLGSIIPESVNDASAHHHVLHNASPARVKSYAVIRKVDKVAESSMSESAAYRHGR